MGLFTSCERKDLYLAQRGLLNVEVSVYDFQLDMLWGVDWQTRWQYLWDESLYGPVGYTMPTGVRANVYSINQINQRVKYTTRNLPKNGGQVSLATNSLYDLMFFNNDTEYILFSTDDSSYFYATTRSNVRAASPSEEFAHFNQPVQLFGAYLHDLYVTDDPDDYEKVVKEDGTVYYVYEIEATLEPYTYIYLCQVILLNNKDESGLRITGAEEIAVSGLSGGMDLFTRTTNASNIVAISQDDVKPLQEDRNLTLPDGTQTKGDIFGARIMTWGLPGVNPMERLSTRGEIELDNPVTMYIGLKLRNGSTYVMEKDITDQLKQYPAGGIVTIVIDSSEIPDDVIGEKPKPGGGFDASVDEWGNEINADIII
jgi:hypothetical protein